MWDLEGDDDGYFKNIYFTKEELALIFQPKEKYISELMDSVDLRGKACMKLNLSTGRFTGITEKQLAEQKHSILRSDSEWPSLSSGKRLPRRVPKLRL
jgi:hypothetical protein